MATECYAQVRGSAIRVTQLGDVGQVSSPVRYATSKSIARVRINEEIEPARNELLRNEQDQPRVKLTRPGELIRYTIDIEFIRVDPGIFHLISGTPTLDQYSVGFGEGGFGQNGFGGESFGDIIGFDAVPRTKPASFGLEVWSRLAGAACVGGERQWGYTLFPFLKGGRLSGFSFRNGLVSFSLVGAQTRRVPKWGVGPYDLEGEFQRLLEPVSRNTYFKNFITTAVPPAQQDGIQEFEDTIDNGTADDPMPDPGAVLTIDGGTADSTSQWIIDGGKAP